MKQRTAVLLSVGLTAFVLVVIGAVAGLAAQEARGQEPTPAPTIDEAIREQLEAREAEYQAALEQANERLEEAYEQIEELKTEVPPTESPEQELYPISADLAVGLALNLAPGAKLERWPELVDFRGTVAYEILTTQGPVYISATDAILLHDGTVSGGGSGGGGGGGEHHDDDDDHEEEHEEEHEDEDEH